MRTTRLLSNFAKGRTNALRHLHRSHRINADWSYDTVRIENTCVAVVSTDYQIGDIFIEAVTKAHVWNQLLDLAQIRPSGPRTFDSSAKPPKVKFNPWEPEVV